MQNPGPGSSNFQSLVRSCYICRDWWSRCISTHPGTSPNKILQEIFAKRSLSSTTAATCSALTVQRSASARILSAATIMVSSSSAPFIQHSHPFCMTLYLKSSECWQVSCPLCRNWLRSRTFLCQDQQLWITIITCQLQLKPQNPKYWTLI